MGFKLLASLFYNPNILNNSSSLEFSQKLSQTASFDPRIKQVNPIASL